MYPQELSITARFQKIIYHNSSESGIYQGEQDLFYAANDKGNGH